MSHGSMYMKLSCTVSVSATIVHKVAMKCSCHVLRLSCTPASMHQVIGMSSTIDTKWLVRQIGQLQTNGCIIYDRYEVVSASNTSIRNEWSSSRVREVITSTQIGIQAVIRSMPISAVRMNSTSSFKPDFRAVCLTLFSTIQQRDL